MTDVLFYLFLGIPALFLLLIVAAIAGFNLLVYILYHRNSVKKEICDKVKFLALRLKIPWLYNVYYLGVIHDLFNDTQITVEDYKVP